MFNNIEAPQRNSSEKEDNSSKDSSQDIQEYDLTKLEGWVKRMYRYRFAELNIPDDKVMEHFENELPKNFRELTVDLWNMAMELRKRPGLGDEWLKTTPPLVITIIM
jgi:hypothetical protein